MSDLQWEQNGTQLQEGQPKPKKPQKTFRRGVLTGVIGTRLVVVIVLGLCGSYLSRGFGMPDGLNFSKLGYITTLIDHYYYEDIDQEALTEGVYKGLMEGLDDQEILERGNAVGAMQVMNLSDNEGLPTISDLQEFLKTYQKKN